MSDVWTSFLPYFTSVKRTWDGMALGCVLYLKIVFQDQCQARIQQRMKFGPRCHACTTWIYPGRGLSGIKCSIVRIRGMRSRIELDIAAAKDVIILASDQTYLI